MSYDTLNVVNGRVDANGAQINLAGVFLPGKQYNLITSDTVSTAPKFATSVVTDQNTLMKYVSADVRYIGDPVVYITPQLSLVGAAQTGNQIAVASRSTRRQTGHPATAPLCSAGF